MIYIDKIENLYINELGSINDDELDTGWTCGKDDDSSEGTEDFETIEIDIPLMIKAISAIEDIDAKIVKKVINGAENYLKSKMNQKK